MSYQQFAQPQNMKVRQKEVRYFAELLTADGAQVLAAHHTKRSESGEQTAALFF